MAYDQGVIRRISWRDLFPWLVLFRTFRIAISPTLLALATLASIVSFVGWRFAGLVFLSEEERTNSANYAALDPSVRSQLLAHLPLAVAEYLPANSAIVEGYLQLAEPIKRLFEVRKGFTLGQTAYYAFGSLWTLAIWAFVGGVITRKALVQLGAEEPAGFLPSARFAGRRYLWYFLAPLYPLIGVFILALPIALVGLPLRFAQWEETLWIHDLGVVLAGLVWILVAIAGLGAMWLLGGLIFGWPLMWPAISAEKDGDSFEAFSRSFSYVYGKPLHYFFYVVVAALFGALCFAVVGGAADLVIEFGFWALSLGGGGDSVWVLRERAFAVASGKSLDLGEDERLLWFGTLLVGLVVRLLHQVAFVFIFTYFWTAVSAIYLLLRMDVDHQEMDEVVLDDDPGRGPPAVAPASPPASSSKVEPSPVSESAAPEVSSGPDAENDGAS
jgi:hypothetical protein